MTGGYELFRFIGYGPPSVPVGLERLHVQVRDLGVLEARVKRMRQDVPTEHRAARI